MGNPLPIRTVHVTLINAVVNQSSHLQTCLKREPTDVCVYTLLASRVRSTKNNAGDAVMAKGKPCR